MKNLLSVAAVALLAACSSQPAATQKLEAPAAPATIPASSKSSEAIAHVRKGEELLDNLRTAEAADEFEQALEADPDFVLAHALHGQATPGPEGLKELDSAAAAAGSLPEAERVLIEGLAANRRGDIAEARTAFTRLTEITPGDWRGHYLLGQELLGEQKYAEASRALKKATELNANAGGAQNMLGYAALRQNDVDGAVAAFTEYARILPQEPNPQDSLGEALLAAGRFKESEAAFQKALEISPAFWNAHEGLAFARFYAGDWAGGRDALRRARDGATRRTDKLGVDVEMAFASAAQRKTADALRELDAVERTEGAQPSELAFVPVNRALLLVDAGRSKDALAPLEAAVKTADSGTLSPGQSTNLRIAALRARVTAEAQLSDAAAAQRTSGALDAAASSRAEDPLAQSSRHYGRGQLALSQGDAKAARSHFDQCSPEDQACRWQAVVAAEKAGDKTAAAGEREQLGKVYQRDATALLLWSRLSTPVKP